MGNPLSYDGNIAESASPWMLCEDIWTTSVWNQSYATGVWHRALCKQNLSWGGISEKIYKQINSSLFLVINSNDKNIL